MRRGFKIGWLTVTGNIKRDKKNKRYECVCKCGEIRFHTKQNLMKGTLKSCGCFKASSNGPAHGNWKGVGKISSSFFCRWKECAKRRKKEFDLTIKDLSEKFEEQNGKCALSGIELKTPMNWKQGHDYSAYNASLDRIDSTLGYVKGNIQWVDKDINMMKQQFNQNHFIEMCRKVTECAS
jgi:hypothetical protein